MNCVSIGFARGPSFAIGWLLVISVLAASGCHVATPDGVFACQTDADCPPGQACDAATPDLAGTCSRNGNMASGTESSGSSPEPAAGSGDGAVVAGVDGASGKGPLLIALALVATCAVHRVSAVEARVRRGTQPLVHREWLAARVRTAESQAQRPAGAREKQLALRGPERVPRRNRARRPTVVVRKAQTPPPMSIANPRVATARSKWARRAIRSAVVRPPRVANRPMPV